MSLPVQAGWLTTCLWCWVLMPGAEGGEEMVQAHKAHLAQVRGTAGARSIHHH